MKAFFVMGLVALSVQAQARTYFAKEIPVLVKLRSPLGVEVAAKEKGVLRFTNDGSYCQFDLTDRRLPCQSLIEITEKGENGAPIKKRIPLNLPKDQLLVRRQSLSFTLNVRDIMNSLVAKADVASITNLNQDGVYIFGDRSKYKYKDGTGETIKVTHPYYQYMLEFLTTSVEKTYDFSMDMSKDIEEVN